MHKRIGVAVMAVWAASAVLLASTPTFWTVSTQPDFLKGDVENLSIDSDGRVFLGPVTAQVAETSAPFLWTVLAGAGGTLWAGSGNEGQVLPIGLDGKTSTVLDASARKLGSGGPNAAAAVSGRPGGGGRAAPGVSTTPGPPRAPVPTVSAEITAITVVDAGSGISSGGASPGGSRSRSVKGAIFRIRP